MNRPFDRNPPDRSAPDSSRDHAQEWQAQERALQEERNGSASHDPLVARYRMVVRALRQPLPHGLPSNFAEMMAARVRHAPLDTRFEQGLMRVLVAVLVLSGAVVAALYGADWLPALGELVPPLSATATNWTTALLACVGLSWSLQVLGRRADNDSGARGAG